MRFLSYRLRHRLTEGFEEISISTAPEAAALQKPLPRAVPQSV